MNVYGLIGFPLGHSFSERYFTEKFQKEGIEDSVFKLYPIESIEDLPFLVDATPDLRGLSVTIPYKKAVIPFLSDSHLPEGLDACNCIRIIEGKLIGYNTDVIGFQKSFVAMLQPGHTDALILGAGGAANAVRFALDEIGIRHQTVSRKLSAANSLTYDDLTPELVRTHTVIINATPLGTFPNVDTCPPIPYEAIGHHHYLFDLVYNPSETLFLKQGAARGAVTRNGYEMLVEQAEAAWKLWNSPAS